MLKYNNARTGAINWRSQILLTKQREYEKNIIATKLLILILIFCIGYWQYTITKPEYSFWKAKKAVDEHDLILFDKYLDSGLLVENIVD